MAYTLTGEKYGKIRFDPSKQENGIVTKETVTRTAKVTQNPVEGGGNVSDHMFRNPLTLQLSGTVIGGKQAAERLEKMWKNGDVLSYTGRVKVKKLLITSLTMNYSADNKKGFEFSLTLQQISVASAEYVAAGEVKLMSQQASGNGTKKKAAGLKTTVSTTISTSAYAKYVDTYNSKAASSPGPATRTTTATNGFTQAL